MIFLLFCYVLLYDFLSLKNVNVPSKSNKQKNYFCWFLKVTDYKSRIRIRNRWSEVRIRESRSVSKCQDLCSGQKPVLNVVWWLCVQAVHARVEPPPLDVQRHGLHPRLRGLEHFLHQCLRSSQPARWSGPGEVTWIFCFLVKFFCLLH